MSTAFTLTVTDIATGWTENRSVPNKAAQMGARRARGHRGDHAVPDPGRGLATTDRSSSIITCSHWCEKRQITFTRSRPGNNNDGCHVEQKNWAVVRTVVGYHRYDTAAELLLLNKIWVLQSKLTNYFYPQQKLISKVRTGAKVSKKYDIATTPHRRAERHDTVSAEHETILADTYTAINPAAIQRQIQALTTELLTITTSKAGPAKQSHPYAGIHE